MSFVTMRQILSLCCPVIAETRYYPEPADTMGNVPGSKFVAAQRIAVLVAVEGDDVVSITTPPNSCSRARLMGLNVRARTAR